MDNDCREWRMVNGEFIGISIIDHSQLTIDEKAE